MAGCPVYIVHTSTAESAQLIARPHCRAAPEVARAERGVSGRQLAREPREQRERSAETDPARQIERPRDPGGADRTGPEQEHVAHAMSTRRLVADQLFDQCGAPLRLGDTSLDLVDHPAARNQANGRRREAIAGGSRHRQFDPVGPA